MTEKGALHMATLAGGCFWCLEAAYEKMRGVERVVSGYIGGALPDPDYEAVCSGMTGHAEAVQVTFDPAQVTYGDLLTVFFSIHDPTTLNRQGNDIGTQYRSAIFYHSEGQRGEAQEMIAALNGEGESVVTEVVPASTFYPAENHHQHYYANHPNQGYCQVIIRPKMMKLQEHFPDKLKLQNRTED